MVYLAAQTLESNRINLAQLCVLVLSHYRRLEMGWLRQPLCAGIENGSEVSERVKNVKLKVLMGKQAAKGNFLPNPFLLLILSSNVALDHMF